MNTNSEFNSSTTIAEGEPYEIDGTNIWNHTWNDLKEKIIIKEPNTSQTIQVPVYEIISNGIHIKFAAFERSNNVWGIFHKY